MVCFSVKCQRNKIIICFICSSQHFTFVKVSQTLCPLGVPSEFDLLLEKKRLSVIFSLYEGDTLCYPVWAVLFLFRFILCLSENIKPKSSRISQKASALKRLYLVRTVCDYAPLWTSNWALHRQK